MLIVCTRDKTIVATAQDAHSGASLWGALHILSPGSTQSKASASLGGLFSTLTHNEALCLSAHGSDEELGDEKSPWGWTSDALADLLKLHTPAAYSGPILIQACAKNVSNFSAHLAVAFGKKKALVGVWIYGYSKAIWTTAGFPDPAKLSMNVELQGTKV